MSIQTQLVPLPGTRTLGIGPLPSFVKPPPEEPSHDLQRAVKAILNAKRVAVVVGAGISTSANIPDFRSSTGLFASLKARFPHARLSSGRDLFDVSAWKDPDTLSLHLGMLAELHKMCGAAQPTAFHQFLKSLDDQGKLSRVYTQNIDGLEEKAGLSYGVPSSEDCCSVSSSSRSRHDPNDSPSRRCLKRKRGQHFPPNLPPTPRSTPPPATKGEASSDTAVQRPAFELLSHETRGGSVSSTSLSELSSVEPCSSQLSSVSTVCPEPPLTRSAAAMDAVASEANLQTRPVRSKPVDPFPRVIPLHGTLKNLSCLTCKHSVLMSDYIGTLAEGETVLCPQCQSFDDARALSGFRTRGVGMLKSGVVLYGEEHSEGDRVGAVTSRDLMKGRRPDLLIVAGTSLKVPGTKRLVKELSKVIRPPVKQGDDSDEEYEESPTHSGKKPPPIHCIFLNNEFPSPCSLWKDTFDVWVKGNVDQFVKLVEEERKKQETIKQKKARERMEREKKKLEKALQPENSRVYVGNRGSSAPSTGGNKRPGVPATSPRLVLKLSASSDLPATKRAPTKSAAKAAPRASSVANFFATGKSAVPSQAVIGKKASAKSSKPDTKPKARSRSGVCETKKNAK